MSRHWWRRLASVRTQTRSSRSSGAKLGLEALEVRDVPAATLVSVGVGGSSASANNNSLTSLVGSISDNGQFVVYLSQATNLVSGQTDTNGNNDVFLYNKTTGTNTLISRAAGTSTTAANGEAFVPFISGDGNWVAFFSNATNIVNGVTIPTNSYQLYLYDRVGNSLTLVTRDGDNPNSGIATSDIPQVGQLAVSDNGQYVAFITDTYDLVAGYTTSETFFTGAGFLPVDAYLYNRATGTNTLVSHVAGSPTVGGNDFTTLVNISGDGSTVVFSSPATNVVSGQSDAVSTLDVFRYDVATGTSALVTRAPGAPTTAAGSVSDQDIFTGTVSDNGRYIAYASRSTNLVAGQTDTANTYDAFLFDSTTGTNTLVSHTASNPTASATTLYTLLSGNHPIVSGNGQYVTFVSSASTVVSGVSGTNVYLNTVSSGSNVLVSHIIGGTTAVTGTNPSISTDGRFVTYTSTTSAADVYRYDRTDTSVTLISSSTAGATTPSGGGNALPIISGDGSTIAWSSDATNLVANDTNAKTDVFISAVSATPTTVLTPQEAPALPNTPIGQIITTPGGTPYQYQLVPGVGDTDNPKFFIGENPNQPGQFFLYTGPNFANQVQTTYTVRIRTTDPNTPAFSLENTFTITRFTVQTDLIKIGLPGVPQQEVPATPNFGFGQVVTTVTGSTKIFQSVLLTGAGDNALFTIQNGVLTTGPNFPNQNQQTYTVVVRTSDTSFPSLFFDRTFTLTRVDKVTDIALGNSTVPAAANAIVGALLPVAPSSIAARPFTYTLVTGTGDADNAFFTIDGTNLKTGTNFPNGSQTSYTVRVRATDPAFPSFFVEEPFTVTIATLPSAPTLTLPTAPVPGNEGGPIRVPIVAMPTTPSSVVTVVIGGVPPGATFSDGINSGNGTWTFTPGQVANLPNLTITVPDNGTFTLTVTATATFPGATNGTSASGTLTVAVQNVAPTVVVSAPSVFDPTGVITIGVGITDPGTDTVQRVTIDWGDGTVDGFLTGGQFTHRYPVAKQTYPIQVTVTDEDGTFAGPGGVVANAKLASLPQAVGAEIYLDILGRSADAAGLANVAALIAARVPTASIIAGFMGSVEYRTKLTNDLYTKYLGRTADAAGLQDALAAFQFLGLDAGQRQLEAKLLGSNEFFIKSGNSNEAFLANLYQKVLGRTIDSAGQADNLAKLAAGAGRAAVAQQLLGSTEAAFKAVAQAYLDFLGRPGDEAGIRSWIPLITRSPSAFLQTFLSVPEYTLRLA